MLKQLKPLTIGDLKIEIPIVQGGMGVMVSTAPLVSAVANCGGAGTIASVGLGYGTPENRTNFPKASREGLQDQIRQTKKLTTGVFGVNIMVALSNYEDLARTTANEKVDFIVSGAGLPLKLPEFTEGSSIKLIPIVSSARAANIIIKTWKKRYNCIPDAIVVEGPLAGGHLGHNFDDLRSDNATKLEHITADVITLVKEYEEEQKTNIPVIAAGGISDGKSIADFIRLGVNGVQIATPFVATFECSVSDNFKQLYLSAKKEDILIINSPVGLPGRVIRTKFIDKIVSGKKMQIKCSYQCLKTCDPDTVPYCIAAALFAAVSGNMDKAVVFAGANVSRINKIVSVKELMDTLINETIHELNTA